MYGYCYSNLGAIYAEGLWYRAFVSATILVFQNNKTAAMSVHQSNAEGV